MCVCVCVMCVCLCMSVAFNKYSPSLGGMVVKEIIRPSLSTTQQQIKPPKKRPKRPKQSSTDILQESKSSQSNSKAPPAKQKHRKLDTKQQHAEEDHDLEVVNEDDTKKNVTLLPVSPRKKESLGIALLKVCMHVKYD